MLLRFDSSGITPDPRTNSSGDADVYAYARQLEAHNAELLTALQESQAALAEQQEVNAALVARIQRIEALVRKAAQSGDPIAYAQPSGVQTRSRPPRARSGARMPDEVIPPQQKRSKVVEAEEMPEPKKNDWFKHLNLGDEDDIEAFLK